MNDKAKIAALRAALEDMYNGWRYIRQSHGDLYGVGWDRAEFKARDALALTADDAEQAMCDDGAECGMGGYCITCPHVPTPAPIAAEPAPKLTECRHCGFMVALNQAPAK